MEDITIISTKATFVNAGVPTTNYGSSADLYVGTNAVGQALYSLIEFDLTTCPVVSKIKTALLTLNTFAVGGSGTTATIQRCTESWVEASVTYNTKPAVTGDYGSLVLTSTGVKTLDIATLVKEWKAGTYSNFGLYTLHSAVTNNYASCRSDDYATEAERPRLVITPKAGGGILFFLSEAFERNKELWQPKLLLPKEGYSF